MDKYFTIMVIPEKDQGVKSFRVPGIIVRSLAFIVAITTILVGIFAYDYWNILQQVYENKHLSLENRQLKKELQLFQIRLNTLSDDLKRIYTFEKKLRILMGLDHLDKRTPLLYRTEKSEVDKDQDTTSRAPNAQPDKQEPDSHRYMTVIEKQITDKLKFDDIENTQEYQKIKEIYDNKIANTFGMQENFKFTKKWSELLEQTFGLSDDFAKLVYQFDHMGNIVERMEINIHELDRYMLDRDSFAKSTPSILPTNGWITSYFGRRLSPTSGRMRMHEGLDVGAPYGALIRAPADGIITFSGVKPGFGKFIQIDHGYGIETIYAHSQTLLAAAGQRVHRGHPIARVGSTGHSTGPHLHYEIRVNGIAVDPLYFILE